MTGQHRSDWDKTTVKLLVGLLYFVAGLIGLVVVVGTIRGNLNPEGAATVLAGLFSGLVVAFLNAKKDGGKGRGDADE